jgi:hypothetical protein
MNILRDARRYSGESAAVGHGRDWADWFQAEREINKWHQQRLQAKGETN